MALSFGYTGRVEPANNRTRILDIALDLFAARGYDAVGVKEIVETAGMTKPTLYHYFGSKQGLLEALIERQAAPFLEELTAAAAYSGNLLMTLRGLVGVYLGFAAAAPLFNRFLLSFLYAPPEHEAAAAAVRVFREEQEVVEALFNEATRDHGNMRGRARRYAIALLGVLNGYAALIVRGELALGPELTRAIVQQFSHGIYS